MKNCVVILGNLEISIIETATKSDFANLSFPLLREVTGYVVMYRVPGLDTLGQLFPNLTRIRGEQLFEDYGLVIFDMTGLVEVGLYSLRKIDRGGVIVSQTPQACYLDTIDWKVIAPKARHVIGSSDRLDKPRCRRICTCSRNATFNHCWNMQKCQLYTDGSEDVTCNEQCLGCRDSDVNECVTCRHFTYKGQCVPTCPNGTIVLTANQYCLTEEECHRLHGWAWNNTCVFQCPVDYIEDNSTDVTTCKQCLKCQETCPKQRIRSLSSILAAEKCVYINGSLEIHIRAPSDVSKELRYFLSRIREVDDYVEIYGSIAITSLDFLSSLGHIKGRKLKNNKYSLLIYDMANLHTLFSPNVMSSLKVDRGTLKMHNNPILCMSKVDELKKIFPETPTELDLPQDTNGYSSGCDEVPVDFNIRIINETSVELVFSIHDPHIHYTLLYVRLPPDINGTVVPETCSDFQWFSVSVPSVVGESAVVKINSLRPASTYAICIETYDPTLQRLARSSIHNFTTPFVTPEPPFLIELVANSHDAVVVRWVDHVDYIRYITRYELDVTLIEHKNIGSIDYCKIAIDDFDDDYTRHAVVMRPPPEYERACESMCGVLSSFTAGALVEDFFDVCSEFDFDCNTIEDKPPQNTKFQNYVNTLALNISKSKNAYQVAGLAPYRDYRFRLRACVEERCSRSARAVVRTMKSKKADVPTVNYVYVDESGHVTVMWDPPDSTNGPILSYTVEILPKFETNNLILPQTWCVSADTQACSGPCVIASEYSIRVCTMSLASVSTCSDWYPVQAAKSTGSWYWWLGIIFGVLLCLSSAFIGSLCKYSRQQEDLIPLVDTASSSRNESEPLTDKAKFVPHSIPLRETPSDTGQ